MKFFTKYKTNKISFIISLIIFSTFLAFSMTNITHASTVGFTPGRIIDDNVFTNSDSMNVDQIQAFLNSKVSSCDTNGTQPASEYGRSDLTHAQYAAYKGWSAPPYTCLKDYSSDGLSSAQRIFNVSQQYNINPQVLIVLLQKEQGLVTDTWPLATQYRSATGYGCPDTTVCDAEYYGFTNQVTWSGKMFRAILNESPTWYTPYVVGNNYIQWSPTASCGGTTVNIENKATQALYNYTPYQPNPASLAAGLGIGDGCSAYGNRNFYIYFTDWFGSTLGTIYNGVDYKDVFDGEYYLNNYTDLKASFGDNYAAALAHFVQYGMNEGRQGIGNFNVTSYKNRYYDLRANFGNNLKAYYFHYMNSGKNEGRLATGNDFNGTPIYNGVNYSAVYNANFYMNYYADIKASFGNDDNAAIAHFVQNGMNEGRLGNDSFNVTSYKNRYYDLRANFGNNLKAYYFHYMNSGKSEARTAVGDDFNGTPIYNGVNYSAVYNFTTYVNRYTDLKASFGNDDNAAIAHFVQNGMNEGRQANDSFNVQTYKTTYLDLRISFGNDLKAYYMHYINNGKSENRTAI